MIFRAIAYVYLSIAFLIIFVGHASIVYFQGWGKLQEILSPFNVINYIVTLVTLAPGLILLHFGAKTREENAEDFVRSMEKRRSRPSS
jgi:hypothetical protein